MYKSHTSGLLFVWDARKAARNLRKHGVSFEEAATAFSDPRAVDLYDSTHSDLEDRFLLIGFSTRPRLLIACYCHQENDRTIRLISARKANGQEAQAYQTRR
jgi:uncharacterized DUF497 family protein